MTDAEFAAYVNVDECDVSRFSPEHRARIEEMAAKVAEIELYDAGLGPKPDGVIVCGPRQVRGAYARKADQ